MEVIEVCNQPNRCQPSKLHERPKTSTCVTKTPVCSKKYVQPARVSSFAPKKLYRIPSGTFDDKTTYHTSYFNTERNYTRTKPFKPSPTLEKPKGKFEDFTTTRLCYQPVWDVVKAKPCIPLRRKLLNQGPMQNTTTVREDFGPKYVEKPEIVVPCANIRVCSGPLDGHTTSGMAFIHPGNFKPPKSFKPSKTYCPPEEPTSGETTHMLSYQPFIIPPREKHPWAMKPAYVLPQGSIGTETTYSKSYIKMGSPMKEKPIIPHSGADWLGGNREFNGQTCYKDAFIPLVTEHVIPIIPCGNIGLSDKKMTCDTTNKLSYQPLCAERRTPIRPLNRRKMMGDGPMQSMTTFKSDFQAKTVPRPEIIIPCDNIGHSDKPLEGLSTSAVAYMNHGAILPPRSFKPLIEYSKPTSKLDGDTVNKLSYVPWSLTPRQECSWSKKSEYQPPKEKMMGDSVYHSSFRPPGYYIEDCDCDPDCPNPPQTTQSSINDCDKQVEHKDS